MIQLRYRKAGWKCQDHVDLQDGIVAETVWGQLWGANVRSPNELSLKKLHVDWKYQLKNQLLHLRIILDSQPSLQTVNLLQCKAIEASHDSPTPKLSTAYCCQVPMPNGSPLQSGLGKVPRWMLRSTYPPDIWPQHANLSTMCLPMIQHH